MHKIEKKGDLDAFNKNWLNRDETLYTHWTKGDVTNQIQFAFRNHWEVISSFIKKGTKNKAKKVLEVGCGRGSLSAYFSDDGFDCTLLDKSDHVIDIAKKIFKKNDLSASFHVGDVMSLPFEDHTFDATMSIGLLEHFDDVTQPIAEQIRVLKPGAVFTAYVVPEYKENLQKDFDWINKILETYNTDSGDNHIPKTELFRSDAGSEKYIPIMEAHGLTEIFSSGMYSVPMISHSIDFPFSLMNIDAEKAAVSHFRDILAERKNRHPNCHPWLCDEGYGQAFLICGIKRA